MDDNYYGQLRKKPFEKRSCTDCLCFTGFIAFIICWLALAYFAYQNADQNLITKPIDSFGQVCGFSKTVSNKPDLLFFDVTECRSLMVFVYGCQTPQICLDNCPNTDWSVNEILNDNQTQHDWQEIQKKMICVSSEINKKINSVETLKSFTSSNQCVKHYVKSKPLLNYCVPVLNNAKEPKEENTTIKEIRNDDYSKMVNWMKNPNNMILMIEDVKHSSKHIFGGILVAILFSLSYILLLKWFSFIIVWTSLLAVVGLLSFVGYGSFIKYVSFNETYPVLAAKSNVPRNVLEDMVASLDIKFTWLILIIVSIVLLIALLFIIVYLRKQIRLSIALVVEGNRAILETKTSLVVPLLQWSFYFIAIGWFLFVAFYMASMKLSILKVKGLADDVDCICENNYKEGDWCTESKWIKYCKSNETNSTCKQAKCDYGYNFPDDVIIGLQLFNMFGVLWLINFVSDFSQLALAITFALWYWTFYKKDVPFFTLTISVYKTIRYHLGTVAFGSLIFAVCSFVFLTRPQYIIVYVFLLWAETKLKEYDNEFTRAVFKYTKYLFWLLNMFSGFIHRRTYIMCAMQGKKFCTSAKLASNLMMRNVLRLIVVDKVTDLIIFVSKLLITGSTMTVFYFELYQPVDLFKWFAFFDEPPVLNYKWLPMVVVAVGSWFIASTFLQVNSIVVDTLMLCFLEDFERNDGSANRPYYMSLRLMNILGTKNVVDSSNGTNRRPKTMFAHQQDYLMTEPLQCS